MVTIIENFDLPSTFTKTTSIVGMGYAQEHSLDASSNKMFIELYVVTHNNTTKDILLRCVINSHLVNNLKTKESLYYYIKDVTGVGEATSQMYTFRTSSKEEYEKIKHKFLNAISIIENMPALVLRKLDLSEFIHDHCNWCSKVC